MTTRVAVSPVLLAWASERSGVPRERLDVRFPKLEAWLRGVRQPTLKQLEAFARATHTPVGYFFLPEPPVETLPVRDFRTRGGKRAGTASPNLLDVIYECEARQEWFRDFALAAGEETVGVVGSLTTESDPLTAGGLMREALAFEPGSRGSTWAEALRRLADHAETLGILVMVSGIVGSNTYRVLDPVEFSGFALVDPVAPVVFVNGTDTKAAQIFTLAHELAHVWLGGSALDDAQPGPAGTEAVERWCNAVAGELLVPGETVAERAIGALGPSDLDRLAAEFRVSTLVVLRRLFDLGRVDSQTYWAIYQAETTRLQQLAVAASRGPGGNFYNTQPTRTSKRFARALIADTLEGRTLYRDAFRMLGFKKQATFDELAQRLGAA